jgi:hypothetical protein
MIEIKKRENGQDRTGDLKVKKNMGWHDLFLLTLSLMPLSHPDPKVIGSFFSDIEIAIQKRVHNVCRGLWDGGM